MPNRNRKFCPNVESEAEKVDNEEDSTSMAKNDENADSGSPSLSEEENNISEQTVSDRPKLVVDLNIPLQHEGNEPGEGGVVNYGFEFGENQRNDCAENFNDSKPLAKDKYVNESANHRYSAALLGKVLNTSCDTEITIPDDPNMNCNHPKTRSGNAKNKENHVTEKIPLEEVNSTVVPIISDNCEKALEAQKEYSATQNGGKDIGHDRAGANTDKLSQQSNGKRFEEYFMPANTHKKFLRGEKLYLTKEKEVAACSGWKLAIVTGSLLLITLGVLLGVLAGVGVLVKEPATVMKGSSLPDSASISAEAKHPNELPLSSLPITVNPNSPSLKTVPKVLIVELTFANESFNDKLLNNNSKEYILLVTHVKRMLTSRFKNLKLNSSTTELHNASIIARFVISLQSSKISERNIQEFIDNYFKRNNNRISSYHLESVSVWFTEKLNTCLINNGNCSHECHWSWRNDSQTCICPSNFILSDDSKTCLKKQLGNDKANGVNTDKTTLVPKTTETPTTHSSVQLVTDVVTTMPNLGSSIWTSVSELTTKYEASTLGDSESLVTNVYNDVLNVEHSVSSHSGNDHKVDIFDTTPNENQILESSTMGGLDYTSELAMLKSTTEEKSGWNFNNNVVTTTDRHWPTISSLTDSEKLTNVYNTSDTLTVVTDSQFSQHTANYTTMTNFGDTSGSEMSTTDSSVFEKPSSVISSVENNVTDGTGDIGLVIYENGVASTASSTVMFNNTLDQTTHGGNEALDTFTTMMEETTVNDVVIEPSSTDSFEISSNWDNAPNVSILSTFANDSFTLDKVQTTVTPLSLNMTHSANFSDNTSPLYAASTESTVTGQETLSVQNVTKEETFSGISLNLDNSSEAILYTTESMGGSIYSQAPKIFMPTEDVTEDPSITVTVGSDFPPINSKVAEENESITETNFDIPNTMLTDEGISPEEKTSFDTTTNHFYLVTSSGNDTIYYEDDEIINDHSTSNGFISDVQNITNLHNSDIAEVSTNVLSSPATVVSNITDDSKIILSPAVTDLSNITFPDTNTTELSSDVFSTVTGITNENTNENLGNVSFSVTTDTSDTVLDSRNNFPVTKISDVTEVPKYTLSSPITASNNTVDSNNFSSDITDVNIIEILRNNLTFTVPEVNNLTEDSRNSFHSTVVYFDNTTEDPESIPSATESNNFMENSKNISSVAHIGNITEDSGDVSSIIEITNITEDSRNYSSFSETVLQPFTTEPFTDEPFTTEHVQTNGIFHEIEESNTSTAEPPVNSTIENPVKDIDEITSDLISTMEMTSAFSINSSDANYYVHDANNSFTVTSTIFNSDVSVGTNNSNNVQFMDFTTYSNHIDTSSNNTEIGDNSTVDSGFSVNGTEISTSMEIELTPNLGNISNDYYSSTSEMGSNLNFDDLPASEVNETIVTTLRTLDEKNRTKLGDTSMSFPDETRSLKDDDNFTSDMFNQSEVFTMDGFSSNTEYENQTDAVNITPPSMDFLGEIANFTGGSITQVEAVTIDGFGSDTPYKNQIDDVGTTLPTMELGEIANFTSDSFNQSDFEVVAIDDFGNSTEYDNQTDIVNMTLPNMESGEIAMNETILSNCSEGMFPCSDGITCLRVRQQCDGIKDCPDGSDESQCDEDCGLNFRCVNTSLCVRVSAKCDNIWDCEDGSDEVGCEPTSCGGKEVMCSDGSACIKPGDVCNEQYNCPDKSDEVGCVERTTCDTTNRFFCPEGLCIPLAQVCDTVHDCRNGEDESNCSCTGSDAFQCSNSVCLPKDVFCNGTEECQDGSDERGCVKVDTNGVVQVYDHNNQTWKVLCAGNWSEIEGDFVCQELGFGSALEVSMLPVSTDIGWIGRNNYTTNNSTVWTLGMEPIDFCLDSMAATVRCKKYACGGVRNQYRRKRETGAQETGHLPGQWTSLALLYSSNSNETCHGVVISPVWVLTSSQCLSSHLPDFSDLSVQAGIINEPMNPTESKSEPQGRKAQEVIIHPHSSVHRSPALMDYDVALIRISEPFTLSSDINAICLGEEEIQEGITCFTGSFQNRRINETYTTSSLSHLAVSVIDRNSCNSTEHYSKIITNRMICGQTTGSKSFCNNDDAVPLMCLSTSQRYHVAGMLSYQHNCGIYYKQPAVFSNINDMRPFIEMIIGKRRYDVPYDGSLYFEATESSNVSEPTSTLWFNMTETTVQADQTVQATNENTSDLGAIETTTLTQIDNFTVEANTTISSGDNFADMTTAAMIQAYLLNETLPKNVTSDILEDSSNKTVLLKDVPKTGILQKYMVTTTDATIEPENNSSLFSTIITPDDFLLPTEIHSTVPSVQEANSTEEHNDTKEKNALDNEPVTNINMTVLTSLSNMEAVQSYQETPFLLSENQSDNNVVTSGTFKTFLIENTTQPYAANSVVDSATLELATEVLSTDITTAFVDNPTTETANNDFVEANTSNPITEIPTTTQQLVSQMYKDSVHSEHVLQSNTSLTIDVSEYTLKNEYGSATPTTPENLIEMTVLINTGVPEDTQSSESLITGVSDTLRDIYETTVPTNKTENLTNYINSSLSANNDNFHIAVPSLSNSTFVNASSVNTLLPFQTSTFPSTSDVATVSSIAILTTENAENGQSTDEIAANATLTETGLIKEDTFNSVQSQKTSASRESYDKSIGLPYLQEYNNTSSPNGNKTSELSTSGDYLTSLNSGCGMQGLEEANTTWPYIGILKGNMTCLASVISSKWVITSYHCLLSSTPANGTTWTFLKGYFHSAVKNILVHPQSQMLDIDVALVELNDSLEDVSSICLPKYNITSQYHCEIVRRIENVEGESTIIYTPVPTDPVMNCDISYNQLSVHNICISNFEQRCQDDGALMCINDAGQWQLQGISRVKQCENNSTSVFTDVMSLMPWIEDSIIL